MTDAEKLLNQDFFISNYLLTLTLSHFNHSKNTFFHHVSHRYLSDKSPTEAIRFPNRQSTIGKLIDGYLTSSADNINDQTIHLLFSANRWEAKDNLVTKLQAGTTLVSIIYLISYCIAYIIIYLTYVYSRIVRYVIDMHIVV